MLLLGHTPSPGYTLAITLNFLNLRGLRPIGTGMRSVRPVLVKNGKWWRRRESNLTRFLEQAEFAEFLRKASRQNRRIHSKTLVNPQIAPSKIRVPQELPPPNLRPRWPAVSLPQIMSERCGGPHSLAARSPVFCVHRQRGANTRQKNDPLKSIEDLRILRAI